MKSMINFELAKPAVYTPASGNEVVHVRSCHSNSSSRHGCTSGKQPILAAQALSTGDVDFFAVFCTSQQHRWLEAQTRDAALDAGHLADLLLGCTTDGRQLTAETYGCMQPYCQVPQMPEYICSETMRLMSAAGASCMEPAGGSSASELGSFSA